MGDSAAYIEQNNDNIRCPKSVSSYFDTPPFLYLQKYLHAVDLEDTDIADLALGRGKIEEKEKSISLLFVAKIWTKGGAGKDAGEVAVSWERPQKIISFLAYKVLFSVESDGTLSCSNLFSEEILIVEVESTETCSASVGVVV